MHQHASVRPCLQPLPAAELTAGIDQGGVAIIGCLHQTSISVFVFRFWVRQSKLINNGCWRGQVWLKYFETDKDAGLLESLPFQFHILSMQGARHKEGICAHFIPPTHPCDVPKHSNRWVINLGRVETGEKQTSWRKRLSESKADRLLCRKKERLRVRKVHGKGLCRQSQTVLSSTDRVGGGGGWKRNENIRKVESQSQITRPAVIRLENVTGLEEGELGGVTSKFISHTMLARWDDERYRGMRPKERPASISLGGSPKFLSHRKHPPLYMNSVIFQYQQSTTKYSRKV